MKLHHILGVVLLLTLLIFVVQAAEENQTFTMEENQTSFSLCDQILLLLHPTISPEETVEAENETLNISEYCRFPEGTVLAWKSAYRQGEGEYEGEVLGRVLGYNETIPGTLPPFNVSPVYIISLPPFYQSQISSLPEYLNVSGGTLLAFFPCSYLDERTREWNREVDWECTLIKDENGTVIGKSNGTGLYRLEEGVMVEGDPTIKVPEVPPDPLEFSNTLLPWMRFRYEDETHDNILSVGIELARTMQRYILEDENGTRELVMPGDESIFLLVNLETINIGHQSDSKVYQAPIPVPSNYRVYSGGFNYTPLPVEGEILSGTYKWDSYTQTSLDRYNSTWGALLFEVPEEINLSHTYLQIDLGEEGKPMWKLG